MSLLNNIKNKIIIIIITTIIIKAQSIQKPNILGLLQSEINKIENSNRGTSHTELDQYKLTMELERNKVEKFAELTKR